MTQTTKTTSEMIVHLLAHRLRVITDRQVALEFYSEAARPLRVARTAIRRLEHRGLVETFTAMVHPEPILEGPILDWRPGDAIPNFDRIAWKLQSRWAKPPVKTKLVWATTKAKQAQGASGRSRAPRAKEISHDVGVSQVYFFLCQNQPELAKHWTGEDQLRAAGREGDVPDAIIAPPKSEQITVDFGGAYKARKLRTIHQNYAPQGRYQIW